jgi:hypothetical protein
MPLTKQQLLIPRVLCIGGKDGMINYPDSEFVTGEILVFGKSLTRLGNEVKNDNGCFWKQDQSAYVSKRYTEAFPHLFKTIPWWYGRTVDEMPEYVKNSDIFSMSNGKVYKVIKHEENFVYLEARNNPRFHIENFEPAEESEYQEYQKQKEGLGKCKEKGCERVATKDYNGHGHYVCEQHYESLSNYFDEEYK